MVDTWFWGHIDLVLQTVRILNSSLKMNLPLRIILRTSNRITNSLFYPSGSKSQSVICYNGVERKNFLQVTAVNSNNVANFSTAQAVLKSFQPVVMDDVHSQTSQTDPSFIDMGLGDGWWPVDCIHILLENVHNYMGLPWWLTIVFGTVTIRTLTTPAFISGKKAIIKYGLHKPEMEKLHKEIQSAQERDNYNRVQDARRRLKEHYKLNGNSPIKMLLLNMVQPFLFMSWYRAISQMCFVPVPTMVTEGILWFPNLTIPDVTLGLPCICGVVIASSLTTSIKLNTINFKNKTLQYGIWSLPVLLPLISYSGLVNLYSGMLLYFITNSMATFVVLLVNRNTFQKLKVESSSLKNQGYSWSRLKNDAGERQGKHARNQQYKKQMKENRQIIKNRAKELKKPPPVTYEIGKEAFLRDHTPDFEIDTRPPKPNIFK